MRDVKFSYESGKEILHGVSFKVNKGEMVSIVGRNGAGKSTISKLICGFYKPTEGQILFEGRDLINDTIKERAEKIGIVMQNPNQMISKTMIFDEVALGLKVRGISEEEIKNRVFETLKVCGLYEFRNWPISALSFGQKKRVTIASILVLNPEVIILDEPTAGLDPKERVRFRNVISSLGKNRMVLLSTHIVSDIDYIADRILIMKNGELIQEGTEKEITDKVEGCVWKCIVSEKEAGQITSSFIVSNMRSSGENVELRIVSERQPAAGAENVESTLEDAYLYLTQIAGGEKNATL